MVLFNPLLSTCGWLILLLRSNCAWSSNLDEKNAPLWNDYYIQFWFENHVIVVHRSYQNVERLTNGTLGANFLRDTKDQLRSEIHCHHGSLTLIHHRHKFGSNASCICVNKRLHQLALQLDLCERSPLVTFSQLFLTRTKWSY